MKQRLSFPGFLLIVSLFMSSTAVFALEAPAMNGPVNDLAGVMSAAEKTDLETYLSAVNTQTGVQVAVLTVPSLEGDTVEAFSMRVADKWKLGQADKNNGALLVVSVADRALRIEVGYGLEATLTDMKSGLIIRSVIVPFFKDGKYGEGIIAGAKNMVGIATDNAAIVSEQVKNPKKNSSSGSGLAAIFFIVVFILILSAGGRGRGGLFWPFLIGSMLSSSGRNRDDWTGRSGGGFGGGGGFSGGGGSFGGGGASGGW